MTTQKWFFPAQIKVTNFLIEKYGEGQFSCNFQDVCEDVVYENYVANKPGYEPEYIQFIIHKGATKNKPQVIHVAYVKYEHTLQYFATKESCPVS